MGPRKDAQGRSPSTAGYPRDPDTPAWRPGGLQADRGASAPATLSRRTLRRVGIAALVIVVLITGGVIGNVVVSGVTAPSNTAISWVRAMGSGDAQTAWSLMSVTTRSGPDASLLTESALAAGLKQRGDAHLTNVHAVASELTVGTGAEVTVGYTNSSGQSQSLELALTQDPTSHQFLFYPTWRVAVTPASVPIVAAGGSGQVTVDGMPANISLASGSATLLLLPGQHTIQQASSGLYGSAETTIDVGMDMQASPPQVQLSSSLTSSALASAKSVVTKPFTGCLQTTDATTNGCPQDLSNDDWSSYTWSLVGDPSSALTVVPSSSGSGFDAYGTYVMIATTPDDQDSGHSDQDTTGGVFDVPLSWTGSAFTGTQVDALQAGTNSPVTVTAPSQVQDSDVLSAVGTAFTACAAESSEFPANCPQGAQNVASGDQNCEVSWSTQGNPVDPSATKVTFDTSSIAYDVTGSYSMNYSINMTTGDCATDTFPDYSPTGTINDDYTATVVWNGTKLVVVAIEGAGD